MNTKNVHRLKVSYIYIYTYIYIYLYTWECLKTGGFPRLQILRFVSNVWSTPLIDPYNYKYVYT